MSSSDADSVQCPGCGHAALERLYQTVMPGTPWMFRCPVCHMCHVSHAPHEVAEVYDDAYTAGSGADRKNRRLAPDYLRKIRPFLPAKPFRFLEVGGAHGWLAQSVHEATGAEVLLLEPGRSAVAAAQARGLPAQAGFLEGFRPEAPFDVVCAAHVIEHVTDLPGFLDGCRAALRLGGKLILLTPNADAWKLARAGRGWAWAVPEQHTLFLNRESATKLLERHGFRPVLIEARRAAFAHYPFFLTRWLAERRHATPSPATAAVSADATPVPGPSFPWKRWLARPLVIAEFVVLSFLDLVHGRNAADELLVVAQRE